MVSNIYTKNPKRKIRFRFSVYKSVFINFTLRNFPRKMKYHGLDNKSRLIGS